MKIGVFSLQGDYEMHARMLRKLGAGCAYANSAADLESIDGLIIPGGESSTMLKLLELENLFEPFLAFARRKPVLGTCAGAILLAREVLSPPQLSMKLMDITVERNAYGRQIDSSIHRIEPSREFVQRTAPGAIEAVFIRAPIIRTTSNAVKVLARLGQDPVLVEQGLHLAATFHPELTSDTRIHQMFLDKVRSHSSSGAT